jgi:O-antigen ligase
VFLQRFNPRATLDELKAGHRTRVYEVTGRIFTQYPIFGIGTRQYERLAPTWAWYRYAPNAPDNQYLKLLIENGLAGLLAFFAWAGYVLRRLWLSRNRGATILLIPFAASLVILFVLDGLFWPAVSMTFMAVAGVGCGMSNTGEPPSS